MRPSFEDSGADAEELRQSARGFAYATRHIEIPQDTYEVLGSLHQALSGVHQSLQQLSAWHAQHAPLAATDDRNRAAGQPGSRAAGQEHANTVTAWLATAALSLEHATRHVMAAQSENGQIAWQPDRHISTLPSTLTALPEALSQREAALDPAPPT